MTGNAKHKQTDDDVLGQVMHMLRMARLLRILRLVRLVKSIPPLYTLIVGIMEAMQGMVWVLLLCCIVLYASALVGINLVGPQGMFITPDVDSEVSGAFAGVMNSMFVLFLSMNGEFEALKPLFAALPSSRGIFMLFIVISTWAILSILTAVVSDNMINTCYNNRTELEKEQQLEKERRAAVIIEEMLQRTESGRTGGALSSVDFDMILNDEDSAAEFVHATGLEKEDLEEVFSLLIRSQDDEATPSVTKRELIEGLQREGQPVTERSVMRIEQRLFRVEGMLSSVSAGLRVAGAGDDALRELEARLGALVGQHFLAEADRAGLARGELMQRMACLETQAIARLVQLQTRVAEHEEARLELLGRLDRLQAQVARLAAQPPMRPGEQVRLAAHAAAQAAVEAAMQVAEREGDTTGKSGSRQPRC